MSIASSIGNNLTTNGVFTASAVNNTSVNNVTSFASVPSGGVLKLISTQTASNSSSIDFTSNIDSTYDSYLFKFINVQPVNSGNIQFTFNMSTDGGSNFNVTKTTTFITALHNEADTEALLAYDSGFDQAQSTAYAEITSGIGNGSDESGSGYLHLFNPSSSTYVKHFISNTQNLRGDAVYSYHNIVAGYGNTTSPVNAVSFKFDAGSNINDGIIKMYGVV